MDRRIDERLRKPRRTKGTPFYIQRNYWAAGVIVAGGLSWFLLDSSKNPASNVESSKFIMKKSTKAEQIISYEIYEYSENLSDLLANSESPYKNLIKGCPKLDLNDSTSDISDFRSPPPIRKPNNSKQNIGKGLIKKNVPSKKTRVKKSNSSKSSTKVSCNESTAQVIQDNLEYFGDNPEHIQMAIALSKSAYELECSSKGQSLPKEEDPDIGDILRNSKPSFLERFGFTSKSISDRKNKVTIASTETNQKIRNRFKYITPILVIRTDQEREELIKSKISLILCGQYEQIEKSADNSINSNMLIKYISKDKSIFNLDRIYQENNYYVNCLEIPQTTYKCGCLLKDWKLIPGRDVSPTRTANLNMKEGECNEIGTLLTEILPGRNIQGIKEHPAKSTFDKTTILSASKETSDCQYFIESSTNTSSPEAYCPSKLSPSRNCTEDTENAREISTKNNSNKIVSLSTESSDRNHPLKCSSDTISPNASCSFDLDNIKESIFKSSDLIPDSITTGDSVPSTSIPRISLISPCRSISPDLFFSDDESSNNCLTDSVFSPKRSLEMNKECAYPNNFSTSQNIHEQVEENYDKNKELSKNCQETEILTPCEFVDLTGDDENINKSFINTSKIPSESITFSKDSPQIKNIKKQSKRKTDIYSLEEFEENEQNLSDTEEYLENNCQHDDKVEDLNGHSEHDCENKNNSRDVIENMDVLSENFNDVINIDRNMDTLFNASSMRNIDVSIGSNSKNDNSNDSLSEPDFDKINDPETHLNEMNLLMKLNEDCHQMTGPNPSPVYESPISLQSLNTKNKSNYSNTGIKGDLDNTVLEYLDIEETPKKYMRNKDFDSLHFDEPILNNSRELNVTDYVNNMLNLDNSSSNATDLERVNTVEDKNHSGIDNEDISSSQSSQSMVILDEELNYSSHFCTPLKPNNYRETKSKDGVEGVKELTEPPLSRSDHAASRKELLYPGHTVQQTVVEDNFIIKTKNVTPMPNYDKMATPQINKELMKVGVKPLKRTRGAKLLKYIYESTHPVLDSNEMCIPDNLEQDEDKRIIKRRKRSNEKLSNPESNSLVYNEDYEKLATEIIGDRIIENEKLEDLIFERKFSVKISSCKVPLQIAWHNFVNANPNIKESILLYEPLQVESLHVMLKEQGFKFHIQDLLTFLDKKCITIRMAQKQRK